MTAWANENDKRFVGRGGLKLEFALEQFNINVSGRSAADFGCNIGGFTDCLLKRGAAKVYAVDTGYGMLDYKLRCDERVIVMERTNILHCDLPSDPVDLVVIDVGWTPQHRVVPVAMSWIAGSPAGCVISLIKPHYENSGARGQTLGKPKGILDESEAKEVLQFTLERLRTAGIKARQLVQSPVVGGRGKGRRGNVEFLALFRS